METEVLDILNLLTSEENPESGEMVLTNVEEVSQKISELVKVFPIEIESIIEESIYLEGNPDDGSDDIFGIGVALEKIISLRKEK